MSRQKKKIDIEVTKELFRSVGLTLDEDVYINKKYKMACHDDSDYKYSLSLDAISDKRTKKFEPIGKYNPYFIENIKNFIKINNGDCKVLVDYYVSSQDKIDLLCPCGEKYKVKMYHLLSNKKFTCNKCSHEKASTLTIKENKQESVQIIEKLGYEVVDYINKKI